MSRLESADLARFFRQLDKHISKQFDAPPVKFSMIAVGGTNLTLRGWKPSTKDVDFMIEGVDLGKVKRWARDAAPDVPAHMWDAPYVFSTTLPDEYQTEHHETFTNFDVSLLSAIDIASTKIGRLDQPDIEDIHLINKQGVGREEILERSERILALGGYASPQEAREKIDIFKAISRDWT